MTTINFKNWNYNSNIEEDELIRDGNDGGQNGMCLPLITPPPHLCWSLVSIIERHLTNNRRGSNTCNFNKPATPQLYAQNKWKKGTLVNLVKKEKKLYKKRS